MQTYMRIMTVASVVVLAGVSAAQAQDSLVTVTVPFGFTLGDTSLPRDTYQVSRVSGQSNVLLVRNARGGMFLLAQAEDSQGSNETQLVFHRYGQQNFLRQIRFADGIAVALPETAAEQEAATGRADGSDPRLETIVLAQRR